MKMTGTLRYLVIFLCLNCSSVFAQQQSVRGSVMEKVSQAPIPGVTVSLQLTDTIFRAVTNENGEFRFSHVPVGKLSLKAEYLGYKDGILQNLTLNAGKELVLTVQLEEQVEALQEVTIQAKVEKNKPLNELSTVSTRTFSVEETQKFAAAVNDPARMASSFAGVVGGNDGNNQISIRGNSPNGLLWRMEGVEIPNPNHFSNVGTSGGGISILSAQLLSNSDFSTGAFAAEYGNALSGVFDLRLRKGNNSKREYTVQAGFLGLDVAAEGPFKKGYDGSYLVNYRYSTLSLLGKMGIPLGDAATDFQDLSFNLSLPAGKVGRFTVFGFGGLSRQSTEAEKDSIRWLEDDFLRLNTNFYANTGAVGVTHTKLFSNRSNLKTVVLGSATENGFYREQLQYDYSTFVRDYDERFLQNKLTLSSVYTQKINSKHSLRTGLIVNRLGYRLTKRTPDSVLVLKTFIDETGSTETMQAFAQWNYRPTEKWSFNLGAHYFQLLLNNSNSIEPRAAIKFDASPRHHFTLGYGLHSQLQPLGVYFVKDESGLLPNRDLGLSKAHHFVSGYDFLLNEHTHIKTEIYYQFLFHIPVSEGPGSTYSLINASDGFSTERLINKGLGKNYGLELTVERFLFKNLYYLLSLSLYESKFQAPNGQWYNTLFNTNYASTFTIGKEWTLSEDRKNKVIGLNLKSVYAGGYRYTPIDVQATETSGETRFDESQTFEKQMPDYYRLDIRLSLKRNYKQLTSTVAIDVQNVINRQNVGGNYFDFKTGEIRYWYQNGLIPILSYRLEF